MFVNPFHDAAHAVYSVVHMVCLAAVLPLTVAAVFACVRKRRPKAPLASLLLIGCSAALLFSALYRLANNSLTLLINIINRNLDVDPGYIIALENEKLAVLGTIIFSAVCFVLGAVTYLIHRLRQADMRSDHTKIESE